MCGAEFLVLYCAAEPLYGHGVTQREKFTNTESDESSAKLLLEERALMNLS